MITLERINTRLDEAEDQISNLEAKEAENTQSEQQKNFFLNLDSLRDVWDNIKHNNIYDIRVPVGGERKNDWTLP